METRTVAAILAGRDRPEDLIEVLQDIQAERGHVAPVAIKEVSEALGVPLIEAFRVVSFYKAFTMSPRGRHVLTVCDGTACHVRDSARLIDDVGRHLGIECGQTTEDGLFTLEKVNCLGACALGPVLVIDGIYHDHVTVAKLRRLVGALRRREEVTSHA